MRYYAKFKSLSDQNLIQRIENKERYQKDAVLTAFKILEERGYNLEYPYPGEEIEDYQIENDSDQDSFKLRTERFIRSFKNESLIKVFFFLILFYVVVYLNNYYVVSSDLVRGFHLLINTSIAKGTISSIIDLSLFVVFFLLSYKSRSQLFKLSWKQVFVAIKVFLFTLALLTLFEITFRDHITVFNIIKDNSLLSFIRNTIRVIGIGLSEELVFKWLILIQLLKRVELNDGNRVSMYFIVSILFALAHIPIQLVDYGHIRYFHLFQTFIFSYFTCTLFIRHQNFILVVLLHILCDLPTVFLDESASTLFGTSLWLIPIYSLPIISKSWLFKPIEFKGYVPLRKFAYALIGLVIISFFIPKSEYDYYFMGNEYYRFQKDSIALEKVSYAIENWGKDKRSFNLRGNVYYDFGEYQKALDDYSKAVEIDPEFLGAIRNQGYAYRQLNKYEECAEALTTVIDEDYIRLRTYYERGDCLYNLKRYEEAKEDLIKVIEADPGHENALYTLSRLYFNQSEYEEAFESIQKVLIIDPKKIKALELKAMILTGLEKYEESIEIMTDAINLGSKNTARFFIRGIDYYNLNQFDKAILEFNKSEEYYSQDGRLYLFWAYSLIELNNVKEGCEFLNKAAYLGNTEAIENLDKYCGQH